MYPRGPCRCCCGLRVAAVIFTVIITVICFIALCYFAKNLAWCMDSYVVKAYVRQCTERLHENLFMLSLELSGMLMRFCGQVCGGIRECTGDCMDELYANRNGLQTTFNSTYDWLIADLEYNIYRKTRPFYGVGVFLNVFEIIFALFLLIALIRYRTRWMLPWLTYAGLPITYDWLYILACLALMADISYEWGVHFSIIFPVLGLAVFALICIMIISVALYYGYLSTIDNFREDINKMTILITTI